YPPIRAAVEAWDVVPLRKRWRLEDISAPVVHLPAFKALAAVARDGKAVVLLDLATGNEVGLLEGHRGKITCLTPHDEGRLLLSGSEDSTAITWNVGRALGR